MQLNGWDRALKVTADGQGLVGHAGAILLRKAADQLGLTAGLSAALLKKGTSPLLDRGTVLASLAVAIALGATSMSDIALLAHLSPVLGAAPSGPTVRRALDLAGTPRMLDRVARARAKAREHAWNLIERTPAGFPWLAVAGKTLTGWLVIDMDATLVTSSSDKEGAAPTWKKGYGLLTELAKASFLFSQQVASAFITVPAHGRWRAVCGWGGTGGPAGGRAQGDGKSLDAVRAGRRGWRRGRPGCRVSEGRAGVRAVGGDAAVVWDGLAAVVPVLLGFGPGMGSGDQVRGR